MHIVDDDPFLRRGMESLFRSVELEARSYESTRAFAAAERADTPECLLLDVRLPEVNGLDSGRS